MSSHSFFVTAPKHLGSLLAEELTGLGLAGATESRGGARFAGTLEDAYRVCLWSRVANRVLLPIAELPADGPDALYAGAGEVPWEEHLGPDRTFAVRFDGNLAGITHSQFGALKVKDAIADRFTDRLGRRPDVDAEHPDLLIHCYALRGTATLAIDLSGASLHRRGYREQGAAAPLKENLAAAILLRAGWPDLATTGAALLDPLCGSGTLVIEGALIAADIAPGLLHAESGQVFGFEGWSGHDPEAWARLLEEARHRRAAGLVRLGSLRGYDQSPSAIRAALANLGRAGLAGRCHFERRDLKDCQPGRPEDRGLVVTNPPYGERMGAESDLPALYAQLGAILRERFTGWRAAVFTGNPDLGKHMGLRALRTHALFNGPIECRLLHFEVAPEHFVSNRPRSLAPEERGAGAQALANRLTKNRKALRRWLTSEQVSCYRLYDADLPEYAVAVDCYEGERLWVVVQEYAAPSTVDPRQARRRLREALSVIPEALEVPDEQVFFKLRQQQKGANQYGRLGETRRFHAVSEGGHRFLVNFEDYLDTGLFLDHRETRRLIGTLAPGGRFLNLFCYTGTATVYAARGGAVATTSVDLSRTYLDWARRNLELNGIRGPKHELIQADCLEWLDAMRGRRRFDLIFLDPPTFSTSKRMAGTLDIQRDHVELIRATTDLLELDGTLIFSNNLRRFRMDLEALPDLAIEDLSAATIPRDFARNPRIHNCWRIRWRQ
ncbi:MAG: bifunctional 23S rRNA (guanine(2069)-N(7))-methyltransferase RlmK/23S rRNA (guanine(2445)-N(2))-methyltransferase RlmL [Bdellovibrio bacteriovorus]